MWNQRKYETYSFQQLGSTPAHGGNMPKMQQADYLSINLDPEFDIDLTGKGSRKPFLSGTIHPFHKSHTTVIGQCNEELRSLLRVRNVRLAFIYILISFLVSICLTVWSSSTNSLALRSYSYITMFEILGLFTYVLSAWAVRQDVKAKSSSNGSYTLGFERFEVLAVFSSVVIAQMGSIFIIKEAIERMIHQPEIHAGRLLPGAVLALLCHLVVNWSVVNKAFTSICEVASSSWIQEHVAEMSRGVCGVIPMLETLLLPRVNPFFLISGSAFCGVLLVDVLLQIDDYFYIDTFVGLCISVITIGTMWPLAACSGRVLLHTTPPHVLGQLDKLLSEAQTLDGVLEIKSEKFYTLSMGLRNGPSGKPSLSLAGSLKVRVRRDADEQMVLAHVTNRLSSLVPLVTVQIVKDDWISSPAIGNLSSSLPLKASQPSATKQATSYYISGFNKPAAAVAPYVQTPPRNVAAAVNTSSSTPYFDKQAGQGHRDDFNFSSPLKSTPSIPSLLKPRTSQTDIAKMYKAAGFKTPQSGMNPYGLQSDALKSLSSSALSAFSKPTFISVESNEKDSSKLFFKT